MYCTAMLIITAVACGWRRCVRATYCVSWTAYNVISVDFMVRSRHLDCARHFNLVIGGDRCRGVEDVTTRGQTTTTNSNNNEQQHNNQPDEEQGRRRTKTTDNDDDKWRRQYRRQWTTTSMNNIDDKQQRHT
jgi:hypothetical protein